MQRRRSIENREGGPRVSLLEGVLQSCQPFRIEGAGAGTAESRKNDKEKHERDRVKANASGKCGVHMDERGVFDAVGWKARESDGGKGAHKSCTWQTVRA